MEYGVKVTVLEKKYIPNCRHNIVQYPIVANVLALMSAMNLCFIAMTSETTFGIWEREL